MLQKCRIFFWKNCIFMRIHEAYSKIENRTTITCCGIKITIKKKRKRIARSSLLPCLSSTHTCAHTQCLQSSDSLPFWKETLVMKSSFFPKPRAGFCCGACRAGTELLRTPIWFPRAPPPGPCPLSFPSLIVLLWTFCLVLPRISTQCTHRVYTEGGNLHHKHYGVASFKWLLPLGSAEHSFHSSIAILQ